MSEAVETDLSKIFPDNCAVLSDGSRVEIHKLKMKYIKKVLDVVARIAGGLTQRSVSMDDVMSLRAVSQFALTPSTLLQLISNNWDEVFTLIALHTSLSRAKIEELDIDDGLILFAGVIRRNADFFVQKLVPLLVNLAAEVERKVPEPVSESNLSET